MSEVTIEWAPFRLAEGVTEEELLAVSAALQAEFLSGQDGFVKRELLRGEGGQWCDLVYWRDAEAARKVGEKIADSPVTQRYFALMVGADPENPEAGVQHFTVQRTYLKPIGAGSAAGGKAPESRVRAVR